LGWSSNTSCNIFGGRTKKTQKKKTHDTGHAHKKQKQKLTRTNPKNQNLRKKKRKTTNTRINKKTKPRPKKKPTTKTRTNCPLELDDLALCLKRMFQHGHVNRKTLESSGDSSQT